MSCQLKKLQRKQREEIQRKYNNHKTLWTAPRDINDEKEKMVRHEQINVGLSKVKTNPNGDNQLRWYAAEHEKDIDFEAIPKPMPNLGPQEIDM